MNPNKPFNPDALLDDYLDGLLSDAELAAFEKQLSSSSDLQDDVELALMMQSAWKTMPKYKAPAVVHRNVMDLVNTDIKEKRWMLWQNRLNALFFPGWKPAFAAAACVLAVGIWRMQSPPLQPTSPTIVYQTPVQKPAQVNPPVNKSDVTVSTPTAPASSNTATDNAGTSPSAQVSASPVAQTAPRVIYASVPTNDEAMLASVASDAAISKTHMIESEPTFSDAEIALAKEQLQQILGYVGRKQNETLELSTEILEADVAIPMAETISASLR